MPEKWTRHCLHEPNCVRHQVPIIWRHEVSIIWSIQRNQRMYQRFKGIPQTDYGSWTVDWSVKCLSSFQLPDQAITRYWRQGRVCFHLETPLLTLLNGFRVVDQRYFVYTARTPSGGMCVCFFPSLLSPYLLLSLLRGIINARTDMEIMLIFVR